MNQILFVVGDWPVRINDALIGFGVLTLILLLVIAVVIARSGRRSAELAMAQAIRADELEERLGEMLRAQSEAAGRVDAMAQALAGRQAEMTRAVSERLDSVSHRVGTHSRTKPCSRMIRTIASFDSARRASSSPWMRASGPSAGT